MTADRVRAVHALGLRRASDALPALREALDDPAPAVRAMACRAVSWLRDPRLASLLSRHFADPAPTVRVEAVRGLAVALGRDGAADEATVRRLLERFDDEAPAVRAAAARVSGWLGIGGAREQIRRLLAHDPDLTVRAEAAQAAGRLTDARAIDALTHALGEPHAPLRHHAARALERLRADGALSTLRARLGDHDPEVRLAALRAVVRLSDEIEPLRAALNDDNPGVRATAALLAGPRETVPTAWLSAAVAAEEHPEVRGHLLRALVLRGDGG